MGTFFFKALGVSLILLGATFGCSQYTQQSLLRQSLESQVIQLTNQLADYKVTAEQLQRLGATPEQAQDVIRAAELYRLNPKILGALISSESSFVHRKHKLPYVFGLGGINTKCGSILPYTVHNDTGNILNAAKLLRDYLNVYGTYFLAIKRYKGYSQKGERQARIVLQIYKTLES